MRLGTQGRHVGSALENVHARPDWTPANLSAARALSDIWARRTLQSLWLSSRVAGRTGAKRAHNRTNCLHIEHSPSEPDEDYALDGLGVQERCVEEFLLGCLCHSLLKMNHRGERHVQKQQLAAYAKLKRYGQY